MNNDDNDNNANNDNNDDNNDDNEHDNDNDNFRPPSDASRTAVFAYLKAPAVRLGKGHIYIYIYT